MRARPQTRLEKLAIIAAAQARVKDLGPVSEELIQQAKALGRT